MTLSADKLLKLWIPHNVSLNPFTPMLNWRLHVFLTKTLVKTSWDMRKLGTKTHFAKWTHILPIKKAWVCCYKSLFLLSPSPLSSVDCVETKLECRTSTLGRRGEGKCLILTRNSICVPRVLTRVVAITFKAVNKTSWTHLLHSTILFFRILQKKFECLDFFLGLLSRVKRSSNNPSFLLTSIRTFTWH